MSKSRVYGLLVNTRPILGVMIDRLIDSCQSSVTGAGVRESHTRVLLSQLTTKIIIIIPIKLDQYYSRLVDGYNMTDTDIHEKMHS